MLDGITKRGHALLGSLVTMAVTLGGYGVAAYTKQPAITIPAHVQAQAGHIVIITAQANGAVKWSVDHECGYLIEDNTLILVAPHDGHFKVLAWTAAMGRPSDAAVCMVDVGDAPAPPGPTPPGPNQPSVPGLSAAWAANKDADKKTKRDFLAQLYGQAIKTDTDKAGLTTAADFYQVVRKTATSQLTDDDLAGERKAIMDMLDKALPTDTAAPLDAKTKAAIIKAFTTVKVNLEKLP